MDTSKKSILIVDSETSVTHVLSTRLLYLGYKVFLSTNGTEAFDILNKEDIDLVILDILLPKLDGYEVCRQIRKNSYIPIIISISILI